MFAVIADPERYFECRASDEENIPATIEEPITLEVVKVVTDTRTEVVRFDCRLVKQPE
jgi:hypothetical protein